MRTTVNLDDDVLRAAKEIAALRGRTLGSVLSELVRAGLATDPSPDSVRNGVPLLEEVPNAGIVTSSAVAELLDDA